MRWDWYKLVSIRIFRMRGFSGLLSDDTEGLLGDAQAMQAIAILNES